MIATGVVRLPPLPDILAEGEQITGQEALSEETQDIERPDPVERDAAIIATRDDLSSDLFDDEPEIRSACRIGARAHFAYFANDCESKLADALTKIFGEGISTDDIGASIAAPAGSSVVVSQSGGQVLADADNAKLGLQLQRSFDLDSAGNRVVHADLFVVENGEKGTGTRIFAAEVERFRKLGISRIETFAQGSAGSKEWNGYYTWARLGYNMDIPAALTSKLEADGFVAKDLNELFIKYGDKGAEWWKLNGRAGKMSFDLSPESQSSKRLEHYLEERGIVVAA